MHRKHGMTSLHSEGQLVLPVLQLLRGARTSVSE